MCNAEGDLMPVGQAWLHGSNADCGIVPPPSPPTPPLPPPPSPPPNHPAWCPELLEIATAAGRSHVKELKPTSSNDFCSSMGNPDVCNQAYRFKVLGSTMLELQFCSHAGGNGDSCKVGEKFYCPSPPPSPTPLLPPPPPFSPIVQVEGCPAPFEWTTAPPLSTEAECLAYYNDFYGLSVGATQYRTVDVTTMPPLGICAHIIVDSVADHVNTPGAIFLGVNAGTAPANVPIRGDVVWTNNIYSNDGSLHQAGAIQVCYQEGDSELRMAVCYCQRKPPPAAPPPVAPPSPPPPSSPTPPSSPPAAQAFHGTSDGGWSALINIEATTYASIYLRDYADGGYVSVGDEVRYIPTADAEDGYCGDAATRARYPADGGADHDFGGTVAAQASGGLAVLVSMPVGAYQACYYKYAPASAAKRRLSVVFDTWTTVVANVGVTPRINDGDPTSVDSPPPPPPKLPAPSPPPSQYFVMDACGGSTSNGVGSYMRNPICLDSTEKTIPAGLLPVDSTASDGAGGLLPWREHDGNKIVVRCCGKPPNNVGATCESNPATNNMQQGNCYTGDAGSGGTGAVGIDWAKAKELCEDDGRRLCSVQELYSVDAGGAGCCGTGCSYDNYVVWTSDVCNFSPEAPPSPTPPPPEPPGPPPAPPIEDCPSEIECYECTTFDGAEAACASDDFSTCVRIMQTTSLPVVLQSSPPPAAPPPPPPAAAAGGAAAAARTPPPSARGGARGHRLR